RAGDAGDLRAASPRERQPLDGPRQQFVGSGSPLGRSLLEAQARRDDAGAHGIRLLPGTALKLERAGAWNRDDQVEAIQQCPRELVAIARQSLRRAAALRTRIPSCSARAQIHGSNELEPT